MTETLPLDDLLARVGAAGARSRNIDAAVLALAVFDPAAAAQWLLERAADGASPMSRAGLATVLVRLASALSESPDLVPRPDIQQILTRYGPLAPPDAAADLAMAARAGDADPVVELTVQDALDRAPTNPGLLRVAAELAAAQGDAARAHDLLTRLGQADPGLATLQAVRRMRSRLPPTDHPPVRIALLSSFTIDPLVPRLDLECRTLGLEPTIYVAPFNSWEREVFEQGGGLAEFAPEIVFLAVAADDVLPALTEGGSPAAVREDGAVAVDRVLSAAERLLSWSSASLVVHGLYTAFPDPLGPAAWRGEGPSRTEVLAELNARLAAGLRAMPRAYFLDVTDVLLRRRHGPLDRPKMRHLARMRLSEGACSVLARAYVRYVAPAKGLTRKCVVLDLDNTLWGGIVGEDGPHGIKLGDTSPGSEYREFQRYLGTLTERGILLAINSKNNPDDALEVIRSHEAMILREDTFSAMRINWENKPSNMLSMAEELGIGVDSFVFIDDSEKERSLMRQALPQVLTPELPRDPALYRQTIEDLPQLQALSVTQEDLTRTRQYAERRQREQLRISSQTLNDYLASLDIQLVIDLVSDQTLPRVHQLFQRTNQFNLTGRRYDLGDLAGRRDDGSWRIYTTHVRDRFGDHGLVATALVQRTPTAWVIENFVMSCRVISYGVEDALLAQIAQDAVDAKASQLVGEFRTTPKNAPAREFYRRNAFTHEAATDEETERWTRDLAGEPMLAPSWITMRASHGT